MSRERLDALIDELKPVDGAFKISIGADDFQVDFYFQLPDTYAAWTGFKRLRDEWVETHRRLASAPHPAWEPYWTQDQTSLEAVYMLVRLSAEPFKLAELDALKMLRSPALIEGLLAQIEARRANAIARALEGVEEAKNESTVT